MNSKARELGLTRTNFKNASGLHDDEHYTTLRDMAAIFAYALENETYLEITSSKKYTTSPTEYHPEGITFYSTVFSRLSCVIAPSNVTVISGKTGYTDEAKHCLATYAVSKSGKHYILITAYGTFENYFPNGSTDGIYQPMYDMTYIYNKYIQP